MRFQINIRKIAKSEQWFRSHIQQSILLPILLGVLGCGDTNKLAPPPETLPVQELIFGTLTPTSEAINLDYKPMRAPGATVSEKISSILVAQGIPPVRIAVEASGKWTGSKETPSFVMETLKITPAGSPLGDEINTQLKNGTPPPNLPLGPLKLLDEPASAHTSPTQLTLDSGAIGEGLKLDGTWSCNRGDGQTQSGAHAKNLRCTLKDGAASQAYERETRTRERKAELRGILSAVRAAQKGESFVSVEEIQLHLIAWSPQPRPTKIELRYHRKACLNEDFCPFANP